MTTSAEPKKRRHRCARWRGDPEEGAPRGSDQPEECEGGGTGEDPQHGRSSQALSDNPPSTPPAPLICLWVRPVWECVGAGGVARQTEGMTEVRPAGTPDAARWLLRSDVDWWDLVRYGPPGFDVYVRIAFDQDPDGDAGEDPALRLALATLATHTATPASGYAAIWEGWGGDLPPEAPRVPIPHREMLLFTGSRRSAQRRTGAGLVRLSTGLSGAAPRVARGSSLVRGLRGRRGGRVHRGMFLRCVPSSGQSPARCRPTGSVRRSGTAVPGSRVGVAGLTVGS